MVKNFNTGLVAKRELFALASTDLIDRSRLVINVSMLIAETDHYNIVYMIPRDQNTMVSAILPRDDRALRTMRGFELTTSMPRLRLTKMVRSEACIMDLWSSSRKYRVVLSEGELSSAYQDSYISLFHAA